MTTLIREKSSGAMLVGLVVAILIMALLITGLVVVLGTGLMESVETANASAAFFAAESGMSAAKAYVTTNSEWARSLPVSLTGMVGRSAFSATITTTNRVTVNVTSTGARNEAEWTSVWGGTGTAVRAMFVYKDAVISNAFPRYRAYSHLGYACGELYAGNITAEPQWQRIAADPRTNEYILVSQNSSRWIYAQVWTGGAWFASTLLNNAGQCPSTLNRSCDVAYEQNSGRGMAVYSVGANTPRYRTWDGTNWSAEAAINVGAAAGSQIRWLRLVARTNSNEMLLLSRWQVAANNLSAAIRWNGVAWVNLRALENCASASIDTEPMDGGFLPAGAVTFYVNGNSANQRAQPKYRTFVGAAWGPENNLPTRLPGNSEPRWIRMEFNTNSTLGFVGFLYLNGAAPQLTGSYWTGAAWGAYTNYSATLNTVTERDFDVAWSSRSNILMTAYCLQGQTNHNYVAQTYGGTAVYGTLAPGTDLGRWCYLAADPFYNEFLYGALDNAGDVVLQRWDGTRWRALVEATAQSGFNYDSVGTAYRRDRLVP
ncbi:MAG: hypothetical protein C0404_08505 [Verrucomicrobia bacterium]|nr:hypothetical protein [Verrucomicrobiota bacterium]